MREREKWPQLCNLQRTIYRSTISGHIEATNSREWMQLSPIGAICKHLSSSEHKSHCSSRPVNTFTQRKVSKNFNSSHFGPLFGWHSILAGIQFSPASSSPSSRFEAFHWVSIEMAQEASLVAARNYSNVATSISLCVCPPSHLWLVVPQLTLLTSQQPNIDCSLDAAREILLAIYHNSCLFDFVCCLPPLFLFEQCACWRCGFPRSSRSSFGLAHRKKSSDFAWVSLGFSLSFLDFSLYLEFLCRWFSSDETHQCIVAACRSGAVLRIIKNRTSGIEQSQRQRELMNSSLINCFNVRMLEVPTVHCSASV